MLKNIQISRFHEEDQTPVKKLILEGLYEHFNVFDKSCNLDLNSIIENYVDRGHLFILARLNSEIIATGALIFKSKNVAQIVRMTVKNNYRRQGVGKEILKSLINEAKKMGRKKLVVETDKSCIAAIKLYESCGFVEYKRDDIDIHMYKTI